MANMRKIAVIGCCAMLVAAAGITAALIKPETAEGEKSFSVQVSSQRDGIERTQEYSSEHEYFGQWCREQDFITWEESTYGLYSTAVDGCSENIDEQYWWCLMVDGESAMTGADELPINDGSTYRFELMQGWE